MQNCVQRRRRKGEQRAIGPFLCPNTELERTLVLTHYSQSVISEPDSVYPLFAGDPCDLSLTTAKFFRFPAGAAVVTSRGDILFELLAKQSHDKDVY